MSEAPETPERGAEGRGKDGRAPGSPSWNAGGDGPAWSRKRQPFEPSFQPAGPDTTRPLMRPDVPATPYAELHCHSNFSFLDGASHPEQLAEEAARLGLEALALTDHDGLYGVVRFAEAARAVGLPTVFGAEITLTADTMSDARMARGEAAHPAAGARRQRRPAPRTRSARPAPAGARRRARRATPACRVRSASGTWRARRGRRSSRSATWPMRRPGTGGCSPGAARARCRRRCWPMGRARPRRELQRLIELFGRDRVVVELWDHGDPLDSARNDALAELAGRLRRAVRRHQQRPLRHTGAAAARHGGRRGAGAAQPRRARPVAAGRGGGAPAQRGRAGPPVPALPGRGRARRRDRSRRRVRPVVGGARACRRSRAPTGPDGRPLTEMAVPARARAAAAPAAATATGPAPHEDLSLRARAWRTIDHELEVIEDLGFAGYFLVVWDIVEFCNRADIFCQGRGSAANSAVCYALGVTKADAVSLGLLFERFLSPERDGPPDIDLDIESDRREEVIQYVYERYGRHHAAQVANVITYRARSSVRDMAKALGFAPGQQDAWSKQIDAWGSVGHHGRPARRRASRPTVLEPRRRDRGRTATPRHPLRRHGDLRPAGHRGVPGRVGAHGQAQRAAVGQGRLRRGGAGEVRPARPRHAQRAALRRRPHPRAPRVRGRPRHHPAGGRGVRDAVPGRHRRRVPDREPSADGHAAAAEAAAGSTTSWSRSRSSVPARSRAARCTRTSGAATGRSRSPTCTRCSRTASARRSACRCSRSS